MSTNETRRQATESLRSATKPAPVLHSAERLEKPTLDAWRLEYARSSVSDVCTLAAAALLPHDPAHLGDEQLQSACLARILQLAEVATSALSDELETREKLHRKLTGLHLRHAEAATGDSATPAGSAQQSSTLSISQARDACSDEAFFVGTSAEALNIEVGGLSDLGPLLEMVLELIRSGRGEAGGSADSLVCVAMARLSETVKNLESVQIDLERRAQRMGYSHD